MDNMLHGAFSYSVLHMIHALKLHFCRLPSPRCVRWGMASASDCCGSLHAWPSNVKRDGTSTCDKLYAAHASYRHFLRQQVDAVVRQGAPARTAQMRIKKEPGSGILDFPYDDSRCGGRGVEMRACPGANQTVFLQHVDLAPRFSMATHLFDGCSCMNHLISHYCMQAA